MNIDELTYGQIREISKLACKTKRDPKKNPPPGRYVVVIDRGWIMAGDLSTTADGYYRLDDAIHVFKWSDIGFAAMLKDWKSNKTDLRPVDPVEIPRDSVIFRVPVAAGWGKK